jgi:DNA-binding MarR family transcriptional regulator
MSLQDFETIESTDVKKNKEFWNLVAKYRRGARKGMMELIGDTARNSTEVSNKTGISVNSAGNYLREAQRDGLVEIVTPDVDRYKMYAMTEKGREVLEEL